MKYSVLWAPDAENDLAAIWLSAADRAAVRAAGDQIDALLKTDAHLRGESRQDRVRILVVRPLAVEIEVNPDDRTARVVTVWRIS